MLLVKLTIKYLILFNLYYIICASIPLTFQKCEEFLNKIGIIYTKLEKRQNDTNICVDYEINDSVNVFNFPEECLNKTYKLNKIYENPNELNGNNYDLYLEKEYIEEFKLNELEKFLNNREKIKHCMYFLTDYVEKCSREKENKKKTKECIE